MLLGLVLVLFVVFSLWRTGKREFEYFVFAPMPRSVGNIRFEDGDWLRMNPEPVVFIRFTASTNDIQMMLAARGFKKEGSHFGQNGPVWWDVSRLGPGTRIFVRQHRPQRENTLYFGKNRRWTEVVRIDPTGTNVYFLVWGI